MDKRIVDELESIYTALKLLGVGDRPIMNEEEYMIVFNFPGGNAMLFYDSEGLQSRVTHFKPTISSDYPEKVIHYEEQMEMLRKIKAIM